MIKIKAAARLLALALTPRKAINLVTLRTGLTPKIGDLAPVKGEGDTFYLKGLDDTRFNRTVAFMATKHGPPTVDGATRVWHFDGYSIILTKSGKAWPPDSVTVVPHQP